MYATFGAGGRLFVHRTGGMAYQNVSRAEIQELLYHAECRICAEYHHCGRSRRCAAWHPDTGTHSKYAKDVHKPPCFQHDSVFSTTPFSGAAGLMGRWMVGIGMLSGKISSGCSMPSHREYPQDHCDSFLAHFGRLQIYRAGKQRNEDIQAAISKV